MKPFYKYIIFLIFSNKDINFICKDLNEKNFHITPEEVGGIYTDILDRSSPSVSDKLKNKQLLDFDDDKEILEYYGITKMYTYYHGPTMDLDDVPHYYSWFDKAEWINDNKSVQMVIAMLLFNGEDPKSISAIIMYKFKKKISQRGIEYYAKIFWDVNGLTAKEAANSLPSLRNGAFIIRLLEDGDCEAEKLERQFPEESNGTNMKFSDMDSDYVKWKLGYREDIKIPTAKSFLEDVKVDMVNIYREAKHMRRSHDVDYEEGNVVEGTVEMTKTKKKNVVNEKLKLMKTSMDMFVRADSCIPDDDANADQADFFNNLQQVTMSFANPNERLASIDDNPDMLEDIKGDM